LGVGLVFLKNVPLNSFMGKLGNAALWKTRLKIFIFVGKYDLGLSKGKQEKDSFPFENAAKNIHLCWEI
jgi:hypothetical protein